MDELILANEPRIRLGAFLGIFAILALVEPFARRRDLTTSRPRRWGRNLAITVLNTALVRALAAALPIAAVGAAVLAEERRSGLLNLVVLPRPVSIVVAVLALDLAIYLQHVAFHAIPALWRLHRVHHADLDLDVTTGLRFHPLEIVLSLGIKLAVVAALGPPPVAVVIFEVLLNATSMFNHANLRIPSGIDRVLRWLVVTPDMHRVHHSVVVRETNSNFGFNVPWWDRLLGTYRAEPEAGHEGMTLGLAELQEPRAVTLGRILVLPFRALPASEPVAPVRDHAGAA